MHTTQTVNSNLNLLTCTNAFISQSQNKLKQGGYIKVNKDLIKNLGLYEAIFLGELLSEHRTQRIKDHSFNDWVYSTVSFMEYNTSLSKYQQNNIIKHLEKLKILKRVVINKKRKFNVNFKELSKYIKNKAYIQANKTLLRCLGIKQTILLSELIALKFYNLKKGNKPNGYDFYLTSKKIKQITSLSYREQSNIIQTLINKGLIKYKMIGFPRKPYYNINLDKIISTIKQEKPNLKNKIGQESATMERPGKIQKQTSKTPGCYTKPYKKQIGQESATMERPGKIQKQTSKTPGQNIRKNCKNSTYKNNDINKNTLNPTHKNNHTVSYNPQNIETKVKYNENPTRHEFNKFVAIVKEKVGLYTNENEFFNENNFNDWFIKDKKQNYEWVKIKNWKKLFLARNNFYKSQYFAEQKRKQELIKQKEHIKQKEILVRKQKEQQEIIQKQNESLFEKYVWKKFEYDVKQIKVYDDKLGIEVMCDISQRVKNQGVLFVGCQVVLLKNTQEFHNWSKIQEGKTAELLYKNNKKLSA